MYEYHALFIQLKAATAHMGVKETGFRKPLDSLQLEDVGDVSEMLIAHSVLRVKAELDQFTDGLRCCGVLGAMREHSSLMSSLFTPVDLTAGMWKNVMLNAVEILALLWDAYGICNLLYMVWQVWHVRMLCICLQLAWIDDELAL